jgi:hypothetical protein
MLLLPLRATARRIGAWLNEVTGIFTTALPRLFASAIKKHAGEQAISVSVMATQVLASRQNRSPRRNGLAWPLPRYVTSKAGFEPALTMSRSIRNLHHQRRLSRKTRQTKLRKILSQRCERRAASREPLQGSLCHRYPACASFPPAGPALLGARLFGASPGIRVSRSGSAPGYFSMSRASDNKKPSGAAGSGGSI